MTVTVLLFVVGLILIIKGGDIFVDKSVWIADIFNIPKFIVGATIVSLATTLPELLVSIIATTMGNNTIAVGNAVGSVTANTALIMSFAIIFMDIRFKDTDFVFGMLCLISAAAVLVLIAKDGIVTDLGSVILFGVVCVFTVHNMSMSKVSTENHPLHQNISTTLPAVYVKPDRKLLASNMIMFIASGLAIALGARFLVTSGEDIAHALGVPDRVIALTLIAVGTSLPELVTTVTAICKKQSSLSVGNIIGANIIDLSLIIPLCSVINGACGNDALAFDAKSEFIDIPICFGFILLACLPTIRYKRFFKWQGFLMLCLYIIYISLSSVGII